MVKDTRESLNRSPEENYLVQVLGLEQIIRPRGFQALTSSVVQAEKDGSPLSLPTSKGASPISAESYWKLEGDQDAARLLIYVPEPMSGQLQELFDRIIGALHLDSPLFLRGAGSEDGLRVLLSPLKISLGLIFGRQWADQLGVRETEFGEDVHYAGIKWRMTYSLGDLLGEGSGVLQRKRRAWVHMKGLNQ